MTRWHWPQYSIAGLFGLLVLGFLIDLWKHAQKDDQEKGAKALARIFYYVTLSLLLHIGGFW